MKRKYTHELLSIEKQIETIVIKEGETILDDLFEVSGWSMGLDNLLNRLNYIVESTNCGFWFSFESLIAIIDSYDGYVFYNRTTQRVNVTNSNIYEH